LLGTSSLDEEESSRSLHTILQHVLTRTWNASDANLDAVQRALAVHLVLQAEGYQLAGFTKSGD
jgi:hypothetical protein